MIDPKKAFPPIEPEPAIVQKRLIERAIQAGKPGYTWDDLEKEGHSFPMRCPEWSGGGVTQVQLSPLNPTTVPVQIVICTCGVIKKVPI